jgi:hypothetical protein
VGATYDPVVLWVVAIQYAPRYQRQAARTLETGRLCSCADSRTQVCVHGQTIWHVVGWFGSGARQLVGVGVGGTRRYFEVLL